MFNKLIDIITQGLHEYKKIRQAIIMTIQIMQLLGQLKQLKPMKVMQISVR